MVFFISVGLAKNTLLCFIIAINLIFVFSLCCLDWVRVPLSEPNFFLCVCIKNYGTQVEDLSTVDFFEPPVVYDTDPFDAVVLVFFLFCVALGFSLRGVSY